MCYSSFLLNQSCFLYVRSCTETQTHQQWEKQTWTLILLPFLLSSLASEKVGGRDAEALITQSVYKQSHTHISIIHTDWEKNHKKLNVLKVTDTTSFTKSILLTAWHNYAGFPLENTLLQIHSVCDRGGCQSEANLSGLVLFYLVVPEKACFPAEHLPGPWLSFHLITALPAREDNLTWWIHISS